MPGAIRLQAAARRSSLPLACALVLAACLAGSTVAPYVHLATSVHRQCAEHGELVDVAGHHGVVASPPAGPDQTLSTGAGAADGHDDHCSLCPSSTPPGVAAPFIAIDLATCEHDRARAARDGVVTGHRRALFRVAPKTSPPAPRQA